jgi:hypothetical protein
MPPEKLTGIGSGSKDKWPTHDARDEEFEATREIAIGLVDEDDLKFIGTQQDLLDSYVKYNAKSPKSNLSSLVKNVIWGLWQNKKTRDNLFPKDIDTEEKLMEFMNDKQQHLTPVGSSLINFAILAVRSGFIAIPMRKRVEEHIESQLSFFLEDIFDEWLNLLKNKNAKFDPSKYKNGEERSKAEEVFRKKMQLRFRLISWVSNSEKLHDELKERYYIEGNMNVFGFFLRKLLNIDAAGAKVKELMIGVIDRQFNDKRKQLLDLIDELKADSKKKMAEERESTKALNDVADGVATKAADSLTKPTTASIAANVSRPGKVGTIGGSEIPVPGRITKPEDSDFTYAETTGEITVVNPSSIPEAPKKIVHSKHPTEYSDRPCEVTDVKDRLTRVEPELFDTDVDEILHAVEGADIDTANDQTQTDKEILHASDEVEPEVLPEEDLDEVEDAEASEPEPAALSEFDLKQDYESGPAPEMGLTPVLKAKTPRLVRQYASQNLVSAHELDLSHNSVQASSASTDGSADASSAQKRETFNVSPPIPGLAIITPQPAKLKVDLSPALKKQIAKLTEEGSVQQPEPATAPAPEAAVKAVTTQDKTLPDLLSFQDNLTDEEKAILAEKDSKKRTEKLNSWIGSHPKTVKAVILGVVLAVLGGSGYLIYKHGGKKDSLRGKDKIASKSTTDAKKEKVIMAPTSTTESTMEPSMGPSMEPPMHTIMHTEPMRQAAMRQAAMPPAMHNAPKEVMQASKDVTAPRPAQRVKPVAPIQKPAPQIDVKNSQADATLAYIDVKTINNLPDGTYKEMWEGKAFDVQDNRFKSITGFLEQKLKDTIKKLPSKKDRYKAIRAYYSELKQLERGWLIYMSMHEKDLSEKAMKGTLNPKEDAQLKYWESYQKSHRGRKWQAKWLTKRYESLMKSKKKGHEYYKGLYQRGEELMQGLAELNPSLDDPNQVPQGQRVVFANGKKVLKTFWRFAHAMNLPMPEKGMSTTGSIETAPSHVMFAEANLETDTTPSSSHSIYDSVVPSAPHAFGSAPAPDLQPVLGNMLAKRPPRIPADARVYKIEPKDMFDVKMIKPKDFGSAPIPELKPVLAAMDRKRKKTPPPIPQDAYYKLTEEDIEVLPTPPSIPVEKSQIKMYGAAPLPKEIKPILGVKPPAIPKDAIPSTYDIPRGEGTEVPPEYASITDDRMPKVGPPPIPAKADLPKQPKKKNLWGRAKSWFKEKLA